MPGAQFNPHRRTTTTSHGELALEYTLGCGHTKVRKSDPPARVGETSFCWPCHGQRTIVDRDVVVIKRK